MPLKAESNKTQNRKIIEAALIAFYQQKNGPANVPIYHIEDLSHYLVDVVPDHVQLEGNSALSKQQILEWMETGRIPDERIKPIPWARKLPKKKAGRKDFWAAVVFIAALLASALLFVLV